MGWKLIGFEDTLNFKAPFGYYDAPPSKPADRLLDLEDRSMRQFTPSTEVDFVVIGSGAGGGVMAKQLSQAGFSVVVLEQGGWGAYGHEQDYNKDELLNRFMPNVADRMLSDPVRQRNTFRRNAKEKAGPGNHSYGCVVGGGTVTYGASSWRHLPYEFNEVTKDPTIPSGTGMADWPITYEELEPYYTQAEWEIGICGERVNSPVHGADVEGLSGPAAADEELRRAAQDGRCQARPDHGRPQRCRDYHRAVSWVAPPA